LQQGADFATIAKQYSDDKLTFQNGGILPEFGTGKFEFPFEQKVFALQKDGDISKPIFTGYGFHIVKRVQQRALPATQAADENYTFNLRQQLMQDKRISIPKANFIKEVIAKTGYKKNTQIKDELLFKYADSVVAKHEVISTPISNKIIFSFSKLNVKGSDWLNFVHDYKLNADVYHGETNTELLEKYVHTAALEYYRNHLEEFSEDFKYQIQEFKEGNMLFETMERNVWSKATSDSAGLVNYYNANKTKYIWAESADVLIFNASSLDAANQAAKTLQQGVSWRQLADESEGKLQADSGRFEIAQIQLPEGTTAKPGFISTPVLNTGDNTASFVQVLQLHAPGQQRSFEEAKGLVINDYQGFLEEEWINSLKKKYPIKVNQEVLQTIVK
jgi:peptidyl-prolyl cis-trans isomerase SurA